jgi:hypothetical protein
MHILAPNGTAETYPYSIGQLRKDNPQTSFPKNPSDAMLASYNVFPVTAAERPAYDAITHGVREITPLRTGSTWTQAWEVYALSADEIAQNLQDLKDQIARDTQRHLDDFAKTRNYDGMLSLCTYATSTNPTFAAEGQYGVESRDATWAALYAMLAEVEAGTRPVPSGFADIEPELPALVWPV